MTLIQTAIWLVIGTVSGAVFVRIAFTLTRYTRQILAGGLILAALVYVLFSMGAPDTPFWMLVEFAGVLIYGAMTLAGLRGSAWWLAAGWAFHPVWDIALHYIGPGNAFAPAWYALACVGFDLVVAGAIAYQMTRGANPSLKPVSRGDSF